MLGVHLYPWAMASVTSNSKPRRNQITSRTLMHFYTLHVIHNSFVLCVCKCYGIRRTIKSPITLVVLYGVFSKDI